MFRIPNYFQMDMTWDDAVRIIKGRGDGTLIGGMEAMNDYWNRHAKVTVLMRLTVSSMRTGFMK